MQKKIISDILPCAILLVITFCVYRSWFVFPNAIYTYGDWPYFSVGTMEQIRLNYNSLWLDDYNFGRVIQDVSQAPTYSLYGWLAKLFGIEFAISEKVVHFYPAAILNSLSPFILYKYLLKDSWGGLAGSLVYAFSTPTLVNNTGHLTLSVSFGLLPLVLYFAIRSRELNSRRDLLIAICLTQVATFYEIRGALLIVLTVVIYYLVSIFLCKCVKTWLNEIKQLFVYLILFLCFNIYWLTALFFLQSTSELFILKRSVFGLEFYDLLHAVFIVHPFWVDGKLIIFSKSDISPWHVIIPAFVTVGIYLSKDNTRKIIFLIFVILGLLFTKLASRPVAELYVFLFEHLPGFSLYREPSKFFELTILGYAYFVAIFTAHFAKSKS